MKYQLAVYRKDGSISGRVVEVSWPFRLTGVKKVTIKRFKSVNSPAKRTVTQLSKPE